MLSIHAWIPFRQHHSSILTMIFDSASTNASISNSSSHTLMIWPKKVNAQSNSFFFLLQTPAFSQFSAKHYKMKVIERTYHFQVWSNTRFNIWKIKTDVLTKEALNNFVWNVQNHQFFFFWFLQKFLPSETKQKLDRILLKKSCGKECTKNKSKYLQILFGWQMVVSFWNRNN